MLSFGLAIRRDSRWAPCRSLGCVLQPSLRGPSSIGRARRVPAAPTGRGEAADTLTTAPRSYAVKGVMPVRVRRSPPRGNIHHLRNLAGQAFSPAPSQPFPLRQVPQQERVEWMLFANGRAVPSRNGPLSGTAPRCSNARRLSPARETRCHFSHLTDSLEPSE